MSDRFSRPRLLSLRPGDGSTQPDHLTAAEAPGPIARVLPLISPANPADKTEHALMIAHVSSASRRAHPLTMPGSRIVIAALLTAALGAAGCGETTVQGATTAAPTSTHAAHSDNPQAKPGRQVHQQTAAEARRNAKPVAAKNALGTAAAALAKLPVKGRAPKTGYSREQFGDGWIDIGGCDTRDRILTRDLTAKRYLDDCRVESGTLADPYTAERIQYTRGGASEVDIDQSSRSQTPGRRAPSSGRQARA